ncbi:hypothetical protein OPT61_g3275 [Boeremia exigua]|uniref:Uncharacterized protein n=1 Tax=Boeremia exigua TaxID=749465 RepID=A0ACC2IID9_9PLEO|nr:hypothetical protein OPT61_g3275 [Boeremia exigua]
MLHNTSFSTFAVPKLLASSTTKSQADAIETKVAQLRAYQRLGLDKLEDYVFAIARASRPINLETDVSQHVSTIAVGRREPFEDKKRCLCLGGRVSSERFQRSFQASPRSSAAHPSFGRTTGASTMPHYDAGIPLSTDPNPPRHRIQARDAKPGVCRGSAEAGGATTSKRSPRETAAK